MFRQIAFSLGVVAGTALVACGMRWHARSEQRDFERQAAERIGVAEAQMDRFFADRALLAKEPLFSPPVDHREDAGSLLNASLSWRSPWWPEPLPAAEEAIARFEANHGKEDLGVLSQIPRIAKDLLAKPDFLEVPRRFPRFDGEGDLFGHLREMDHWKLDGATPYGFFKAPDPLRLSMLAPRPLFFDLRYWARWRLMSGLRIDKPARALADVRHVARLLITTEDSIALENAVGILEDEELVVKTLGRIPIGHGWKPLPPGVTEAARRHLLAVRGVLVPGMTVALLERVLDQDAPGVCAALADALPWAQEVRSALEERHRDFYALLDRLMTTTPQHCRLARSRAQWRRSGDPSHLEQLRAWIAGQLPSRWHRFYWRLSRHVPMLLPNPWHRFALAPLKAFEERYLSN